MPAGIIVSELLSSAMRRAGALASGETASADEINDALLVLNDILENLSTERLSVWAAADLSFTLVPGQSQYTMGPAGNVNVPRPIAVLEGYTTVDGVSFPVTPIDQTKYNLIALKTQPGTIVERMLYVPEYPLGVLTLWPVPDRAVQLTLSAASPLELQNVTLSTALAGPPGFAKMIRYVTALELCGEFQIPPDKLLVQLASDSKADYKRANTKILQSSEYDSAIIGYGVSNWRQGY